MKLKEKISLIKMMIKNKKFKEMALLLLYFLIAKREMKIREKLIIKKIREGKIAKVKLPNGKYLKVSNVDLGLSIDLLLDKEHLRENSATKELLNFLKEYTKEYGKIKELIDVGANIGFFTVLLSNYFNKIVAIEPLPDCIKTLKENVRLNRLNKKVRIIQAAVGSKDGYVKMKKEDSLNLSKLDNKGNLKVRMININKILKKNSFLKMDIEGYEYEVIKSMKIFPKFIYLELHINLLGKKKTQEILECLEKNGYKIKFGVRKEGRTYNRVRFRFTRWVMKRMREFKENFKVGKIQILNNASPTEINKLIKYNKENHLLSPPVINMLLVNKSH